ncbi:hypothetical protein C8J55DRAFT_493065 [Lentinula edodes]|uniref:Uncharacterized protein n=1 Tax=Lentinula lateritia TaxID=40482 RepID=A0A9W8ZT98_9AGAR|nr:hypothetical protein C8J55DRAFT_493065 [Lentinula edodes]
MFGTYPAAVPSGLHSGCSAPTPSGQIPAKSTSSKPSTTLFQANTPSTSPLMSRRHELDTIREHSSNELLYGCRRGSPPASISQANSSSTINLTDWGTPNAAYLFNACNIAQYCQPQQLIIDFTLCGVWAGVPSIYNFTGCSGQCVRLFFLQPLEFYPNSLNLPRSLLQIDNVIGTGNLIYNNAYWDIAYTRTYLATATTTLTMGNASVSPASKERFVSADRFQVFIVNW